MVDHALPLIYALPLLPPTFDIPSTGWQIPVSDVGGGCRVPSTVTTEDVQ